MCYILHRSETFFISPFRQNAHQRDISGFAWIKLIYICTNVLYSQPKRYRLWNDSHLRHGHPIIYKHTQSRSKIFAAIYSCPMLSLFFRQGNFSFGISNFCCCCSMCVCVFNAFRFCSHEKWKSPREIANQITGTAIINQFY